MWERGPRGSGGRSPRTSVGRASINEIWAPFPRDDCLNKVPVHVCIIIVQLFAQYSSVDRLQGCMGSPSSSANPLDRLNKKETETVRPGFSRHHYVSITLCWNICSLHNKIVGCLAALNSWCSQLLVVGPITCEFCLLFCIVHVFWCVYVY